MDKSETKSDEWTLVVNKRQKNVTFSLPKIMVDPNTNYEKITIKRNGQTKTY